MTVAAVVLVPDPTAALADAEGDPAIRRVLQSAWAGGAIPLVVVCAAEGAGALIPAVEDLPVTVSPAPPGLPAGAGWFAHGASVAAEHVTETSASLLWPFRYTWVDPETVTTLIEAHGAGDGEGETATIIRPALDREPGFPILVPASLTARFAERPDQHGWERVEALIAEGVAYRTVETGDPGIVHHEPSRPPSARSFEGPPEPAGGQPPEWNASLGTHAAQVPLEGPALAPFDQAEPGSEEHQA